MAGSSGAEPERCATKGTKCDHDPKRKTSEQTTTSAMMANFTK